MVLWKRFNTERYLQSYEVYKILVEVPGVAREVKKNLIINKI